MTIELSLLVQEAIAVYAAGGKTPPPLTRKINDLHVKYDSFTVEFTETKATLKLLYKGAVVGTMDATFSIQSDCSLTVMDLRGTIPVTLMLQPV